MSDTVVDSLIEAIRANDAHFAIALCGQDYNISTRCDYGTLSNMLYTAMIDDPSLAAAIDDALSSFREYSEAEN